MRRRLANLLGRRRARNFGPAGSQTRR